MKPRLNNQGAVLVQEARWLVMAKWPPEAAWCNFLVFDLGSSRREKYRYQLSYDGERFARSADLVRMEMDHPLALEAVQKLIAEWDLMPAAS